MEEVASAAGSFRSSLQALGLVWHSSSQTHRESSYFFPLGFSRSGKSVRFGHTHPTGSWRQDIASGRQVHCLSAASLEVISE